MLTVVVFWTYKADFVIMKELTHVVFLIVFPTTALSCLSFTYLIHELLLCVCKSDGVNDTKNPSPCTYLWDREGKEREKNQRKNIQHSYNLDQQLAYLLAEWLPLPPKLEGSCKSSRKALKLHFNALVSRHFMCMNTGAALKIWCSPWVCGSIH